MIYKVEIFRIAVKQLGILPAKDYRGIKSKIMTLSVDLRPHDFSKLKGRNGFRIRHGSYTIVDDIREDLLAVRVIRIGHRKDVYRLTN